MKTRLALLGALGLLGAVTGGLRQAAVCGQTASQNQPAGAPGKLLYQEVVVAQKSACRVQGLDSRYDLRYAVLSSLTVNERNDGRLDVQQKIEAAKLLQADEDLPVDLDEEQSFRVRLLERDPRLRQAVEPGRYGSRPGTESSGHETKEQQAPKAKTETDHGDS